MTEPRFIYRGTCRSCLGTKEQRHSELRFNDAGGDFYASDCDTWDCDASLWLDLDHVASGLSDEEIDLVIAA